MQTSSDIVPKTRGSVSTPKGTTVTTDYDRTELSQYAIAAAQSDVALNYPSATEIRIPTNKYNCHSYAWYSTATSNKHWIYDPSAYWTDGSYSMISKTDAVANCKMVYRDSLSIVQHSAIIYSYTWIDSLHKSFIVTSKWGNYGLYRHSYSYVPAIYGTSTTCYS